MQGRRQAASATSSYSDGEHTLTIVTTDGDKRLLAKDKDGQVLFDGPINTPEQRKAVPAEVLRKLQIMERSMRFDVRMGNGGAVANVMAFMNAGGGPIAVVGGPGGGRAANLFSGKQETWADQEHTLTLTTRGGEKYLTVTQKDDAGTVVFEGPVQTDEQRMKVPADILKKLQEWEAKRREESRGEVSLIEDGMTVTLTTELGKQRVVARDSTGKVLFDGPVDTEDERAKMPEKVRTKVEKLWKSCAAIWSSGSEP
jgi:hypothetical protein